MDKENHPTTGLFVSVQSVSPLNGFICAVHGQSFSFLTVVVVFTWVTVGNHDRHYWQNGGTALNPLPLFSRHGPGMKELGFVILTCFFLSLAELTEENIKVLIVFERSMRRHKAFCSCAQRIIHKVNHWHLFKDFYKKVFQGEHTGRSLRPWEGLLSEAHLWEKFMAKSLLNLGPRNN